MGILLIYFNQAMLFFCYTLTVVLHEIGHAFVGKILGYKLNTISLMPYGASLSGNNVPFKPKDEIIIAMAGPIVNVLLILIIVSLWWFFPTTYSLTQQFFASNLSTIIFNLMPIFPLDGGRVLLAGLSCKIERKKAFKITKIIGFIITTIGFILFFISAFNQINYSLGLNSILLLIGLFDDDKSSYYINLKTMDNKTEKLEKGLFLRTIAISENSTIYDAYKVLDKNELNQIYVLDDNGNIILTLMEKDLDKMIFSLPLNTKLKNFI